MELIIGGLIILLAIYLLYSNIDQKKYQYICRNLRTDTTDRFYLYYTKKPRIYSAFF